MNIKIAAHKAVDVYIGLGGNIGDSLSFLKKALYSLSLNPYITIKNTSRFYQTTPVSTIKQNNYINAVCLITTILTPQQLLKVLQEIEKDLGKNKLQKDGPRTIDLDILLFGDQKINEKDLQIPHPRFKERLFVLMPLLDLTPQIVMPQEKDEKTMLVFDIIEHLKNFPNTYLEIVTPL